MALTTIPRKETAMYQLPRKIHHARASLLCLFDHQADRYDRIATWFLRRLYPRVVADVAAAGSRVRVACLKWAPVPAGSHS